jgi:hypothetical protein
MVEHGWRIWPARELDSALFDRVHLEQGKENKWRKRG